METNQLEMRVKMKGALDELNDKASMFTGAEQAIAKKEEELSYIKNNFDSVGDKMRSFETERNMLAVRLKESLSRNLELTAVNSD